MAAGWREWVAFPGIEVDWIKAKLDTGARSSAIHAFDIGSSSVTTSPGCGSASTRGSARARTPSRSSCPSTTVARVRSSTGHVQERYVVLMDVSLVGRTVTAEVTLTGRDQMGFRMLIGREALRQGYLIDSRRSYLGGRPKRSVRRRNRGV